MYPVREVRSGEIVFCRSCQRNVKIARVCSPLVEELDAPGVRHAVYHMIENLEGKR